LKTGVASREGRVDLPSQMKLKLWLSFVVHAETKTKSITSPHLFQTLRSLSMPTSEELLVGTVFEDLYSNNNLVANIENSFVVFYIIIL